MSLRAIYFYQVKCTYPILLGSKANFSPTSPYVFGLFLEKIKIEIKLATHRIWFIVFTGKRAIVIAEYLLCLCSYQNQANKIGRIIFESVIREIELTASISLKKRQLAFLISDPLSKDSLRIWNTTIISTVSLIDKEIIIQWKNYN